MGIDIDAQGISAASDECHRLQQSVMPPVDGNTYCNLTWDGWGCWNYTLAGDTAHISCPWYITEFDQSLSATRKCDVTGDWMYYPEANGTWSDYRFCVNQGDVEWHKIEIYTYVAGYSISILALLISLVIFFYFKQLQCDRITLHKNLFISYILNGVVWIPYYTEASMRLDVLEHNPAWCQALHIITQYFVTCNFFWMFCEGLYLHTIIVVAFLSGKKLVISCYVIGWGIPFVTTLVYSVTRALDADASISCWLVPSHLAWIVFAPIIITLLANVVFLCNIVRVLVTKMRAVNSPDTNQSRKAVRATVILIPLLGLQFILFPFTPESGIWKHVVSLGSAIATSFQGFFVALIFCFLNGEVLSIIKRKWGQHRLMHGKHGRSPYYTQATFSLGEPAATNHVHNEHKNNNQSL